MKVLMLVTYLNTGGTETYVLSLATSLRAQGVQVGIATTGGNYLWAFKRAGVKIHRIPKKATSRRIAQEISHITRIWHYNLIHAHDSESFEVIGKNPRLIQVPSLITIHGKFHTRDSITLGSKIARKVIVVSSALRNWIRNMGVSPQKIILIPNGIDAIHFSPSRNSNEIRQRLGLPKNAQVVGYVGRFSKDKLSIAQTVMKTSRDIASHNLRYITLLKGVGQYTNQLKQLATQINKRLGRRAVIVLSPTMNVVSTYRSSDIVVGTGRVAMEALACQKPVIAAGVAGYHGIVKPINFEQAIKNQFGDHLATKKITQQILAKDIHQLLSNPKYALLLGRFGRKQIATHFSIKQITVRMKRLYSSILFQKQ